MWRFSQGFSSISVDAAEYYDCSEVMINTLVTVSNIAQITVALIWTMNLESTHGLQIPFVVGAGLLVVGGWLSYYGAAAARQHPRAKVPFFCTLVLYHFVFYKV